MALWSLTRILCALKVAESGVRLEGRHFSTDAAQKGAAVGSILDVPLNNGWNSARGNL
jgi:hypothetical protein